MLLLFTHNVTPAPPLRLISELRQRRVTTISQYLIAKVRNILETKEDFEKKIKYNFELSNYWQYIFLHDNSLGGILSFQQEVTQSVSRFMFQNAKIIVPTTIL